MSVQVASVKLTSDYSHLFDYFVLILGYGSQQHGMIILSK